MATFAIPMAMVVLTTATQLGAASRGPRASSVGLVLTKLNDRLIVIDAAAQTGFASWDQIVAVNGRRVSTETAFMSRLAANNGATILVNRNGNHLTMNLAAGGASGATSSSASVSKSSGFLNPALLVRTPQGVMHIETARRLGLPGTPIHGSPPGPPFPPPKGASGFLNPALLVKTSQGVMHIETAKKLGLPGTPIHGSPPGPPFPTPKPSGFLNPALLVLTSQGVMHIETAKRLGLPGTPIHGTPPPPLPK
jgi:ribosomal protein S8